METLERLGPEKLGPGHLAAVTVAYRDALRAHQEVINRLNVYPVPDGDTGTNMALTLESVVKELEQSDPSDPKTVYHAITHGSLMGARGNSGVILSQILRGIAAAFGEGAGDATTLVDALARASAGAYQAVMKPVEGTILSVIRASSEASAATLRARSDEKGHTELVEILGRAKEAAAEALERTPDQLDVLKAAGVVDAGGAGLVLLFDAFLNVVAGRPLPDAPASAPASAASNAAGRLAGDERVAPEHDAVGDLRYEVMYFLEAPDETITAFRDVWAGLGDSIVVVGGDGLWNCHIHTDDIGGSIEAALDVGRPRKIRVTDLFEEVEEERWVREAAAGATPPAASVEPVTCAVVAVATGEGIRRIFHSLGVQQIVAGGQSMNPATAEIVEAIDAAPGDDVIVLPNNKNIIPVSEAAADLSSKTVRVVPTRGVAEGFAALLEYDPGSSADDNAQTMAEAAERVTAGEITRAVRDSSSEAGPIKEGDYLGLSRSGIVAVQPNLSEAAQDLLAKLVTDSHEIVTIIEGEGATKGDTRRITEWLEENRPGV